MFHKFVNTQYFTEAGRDYWKNGGHYTLAPRGSLEYHEYWKEQERRCREGYRVGDVWITGRHYFHLNFQPMQRVIKENLSATEIIADQRSKVTGKVSKNIIDKVTRFGLFTETQYEWWRFKHISWYGGSFMGINCEGGKHLVCCKTREAGWSLMEAADGVYNFNFIPGSKSFYLASKEPYLIDDGILNKVETGLNWINDNCPYWKQNRHKHNSITDMKFKASFIDEFGEERGSMAEIMGETIGADPNKVRGKRGIKQTFEEGGSFKNLLSCIAIAKGNVSAGTRYTGQISVFGTGGEVGDGIVGLQTLFTEPDAHDFFSVPNIFEEGGMNERVGIFVPCYRTNFEAIDEVGNVDYQKALALDDEVRKRLGTSKDPKTLDKRKAEYPRTPSELFQRIDGNEFLVAEIDKQIRKLTTQSTYKNMLRHGKMERNKTAYAINGVEFIPDPKAQPLDEYPHVQQENGIKKDLSGCVTILEKPYVDSTGKVPSEMYQIVFDAYYKDEAEDLTSLFDITVIKQYNGIDDTYATLPVAWYTGRPQQLKTCHEILFMLADYYNCKVQGEVAGGGQGVIDYAKAKPKLMARIDFEPEMLHNKEIASSSKNRSYLMNMPTERKKLGMMYLVDWHKEPIGFKEDGKPLLRLERIYKLGLLREMRAGGIRNSDRMSSMLIGMFCLKENIIKNLKAKKESKESFYDRQLFQESSPTETTTFY
jgi:hypothetical protein